MSSEFLAKVRDRIHLVRSAHESLRSGIMERNEVEGSRELAITSDDGKLRLVWNYQPFYLHCDTAIHERRIDCAIFKDGQKVVAADFLEFKTTATYGNKAFFQHLDDEDADLGEIALAYLSGWDAEDLDDGNLAVLEHVASTGAVSAREWTPLFQKFVNTHILKNAFVLIAKPFPHDVIHIINEGHEDDAMQAYARVRHDANIKFCKNHLGMDKFGDQARDPDWTYQMSKATKFEGCLLAPEFRSFEIRDLHKPMRHNF